MSKIKVWVVERGDRQELVLVWNDPVNGHRRQRSARTTKRKEAERAAGQLALELENEVRRESVPWDIARDRYEKEVLRLQRPKSLKSFATAATRFEGIINPRSLDDASTDNLSRFTARLHKDGLSTNSLASYLRELRRFLRWAAEIWPAYTVPKIRTPRVPKRDLMKGRPITAEEFERMLEKTADGMLEYLHVHWQHQPNPRKVKDGQSPRQWKPPRVTQQMVESWRFLLRGLWESGFRLGEALDFWWDHEERLHVFGIDQRRPLLRYFAESEKGNRDRMLPMTPGFARLLWSVPQEERCGLVFNPVLHQSRVNSMETASAVICAIGKAANVVVSTNRHGRPKFASAQDLRRSFGSRLAPKLHPMELKELMRHESLETTMRYYVGIEAARMAGDIWERLGGESCDQACDTGDADSAAGMCRKFKLPKNVSKELGY